MTSERAARVVLSLLLIIASAATAAAQPLSLSEAIRRARVQNPDVAIAAAAEREAAERVVQARGAYFPRVDLFESWQRGTDPVFAFSSLLSQRRFTAADFALDALNHPVATNNFRTGLSFEQPLFDRSAVAQVRAATIERQIAATGRELVNNDLAAAVTEAFGHVLVAVASVRSTAATVETVRADHELARNRRDAGRATDADVLQLDVYLARALERQVQAGADERIGRARLNQLMGEPLNARFSLDVTPPATAIDIANAAGLEDEAVKNRPEVALAHQQEQLAAAGVNTAHAAFLPKVSAQGVWELNGGTWNSRASAWSIGAVAQINLFHGFADQARLAEARDLAARRRIETDKAETAVRLDVQIAIAQLETARAREAVGRAAADSARTSHRIVRDRYENGLADVAMLMRAADAVEQADAQQTAALVNVITATAALQRAIGKL